MFVVSLGDIFSNIVWCGAFPLSAFFCSYFILARTVEYLVYVFICLILDHTQGSHNYWKSRSFKEAKFLKFYVKVFVFIFIYYPVGKVFANGSGDRGSIPVRVIRKT